ncbi:MAG: DUF2569 family protein [Oscillospiraceae bacterium]|jgi:hypothetical protein|nr:DUF2569 family protein [Oscillospiraceae bacterium]
MMFCTGCGSPHDNDSMFCKYCNTPLSPPTTEAIGQNEFISTGSGIPPDHKYRKLGGWLLFFVIINIIAIVVDAFGSIPDVLESIELFAMLGEVNLSAAGLPENFKNALTIALIGEVVGLLTIVFSIIFVVQVFNRKSTFLRFAQLSALAGIFFLIVARLIPNTMVGIDYMGEDYITPAISSLIGSIIGFFIFPLYYCKSIRVRTYMGSDEYMHKAIFAYKNQPPLDLR